MKRSTLIIRLGAFVLAGALVTTAAACGAQSDQPMPHPAPAASTATAAPVPAVAETPTPTGTPAPTATPASAAHAASPTTPRLRVGEERYYAAKVGGQVMGYATFKVTGQSSDGLTTESRTLLKFTSGGEPMTMDYRAHTLLTPDLRPLHYTLDYEVSGQSGKIDVVVDHGAANLKASAGGQEQALAVPVSPQTFLMDNNLIDQNAYIFAALKLEPGADVEVPVLVPQAGKALALQGTVAVAPEEVKVGDRSYGSLVVSVEQPQAMKVWVTQDGLMVRMSIPSQNFELDLADESVIGKVTSVDIFAALANAMADSNVRFSDFSAVEHMTAEIDVQALSGPVDAAFLNRRGQSFAGTAEGKHIVGRVTTADTRTLDAAPPEPDGGLIDPQDYLKPAAKIESDDPTVVARAQALTRGIPDRWQAAQAIGDWVYKNIRYKITGSGAREALQSGVGDCGPHTMLSTALLRAAGIPARPVGGVMYANGKFGQHYWTEVYLENEGWVPMDTTVGEFGYLDATHIRLWALDGVASLQIKVTDYSERAAATPRAESKRGLTLTSGESALYRILVDDKELGTSGYKVTDVAQPADGGAYRLSTSLDLDLTPLGDPGQAVHMTGELRISPMGVPLLYSARATVGADQQTVDAQFTPNQVHEKAVAGGTTVEKDVTLPEGNYLLGNNQIGLFDLMYRTLPLREAQELTVPVYFAENFATMNIRLKVGEKRETITVGGKRYDCYVVEIGQFGPEIDYVSTEGRLVRTTVPSRKVVVDLSE